jgi:hypothetical protein
VWLLWPFVAQGAAFPLGPDAPVYLWWTRIAGAEGLSAVGGRAGAPALALVLQGTLGVSVVAAVAALEISLGVAVGLASAALLRGRTTTAGWVLAGALAGTFAVHLAAGYLANLLEITAFLAAAVALAGGTRRGAWVAAGALAAGGLAHPLFFLLSAVVLLLTAASAWRRHRDEATRVAAAVAGGGAVVGIGLVALLAGPAPLDVDTSRDAFLRRAGLTAELRASYLDRFVHRWTRYVQWVSVPLAVVGIGEADGFVGRFLRAWGVALVAGVAIGLLTGWFPADRVVTFGFVVPILAALGVVRVSRWLGRRRALALAVAAGAVLAMLAGSFIAWNRQEPFLSVDEVRAVTIAGEAVAEVELATPLAFLVNDPDRTVSFLATRAGNVIRAGVPADRIRDVVVVVPAAGDGPASAERRALEELTASDLRRAETVSGTPAVRFVLVPFDPVDRPADAVAIDPSSPVKDLLGQTDPLEPSSAGAIGVSSVLALALLTAVGYGWARIAVPDAVAAAAVAPALGAAALVLVAIALERLGLAIGTTPGAWVVSAAAGGGGYVAWRVLERFAPVRPTPQVDQ